MAQRLLWLGMLLVVVDLPLNSFDVLPDALGWALVLAALVDLRVLHRRFATGLAVAGLGLVTAALHMALFFSERSFPAARAVVQALEALSWWLLVGCVLWAVGDLLAPHDRSMAVATRRLLVVLLAVGVGEVVVRLVVALVMGRGHLLAGGGWLSTLAHLVLLACGAAAALWVAHCGARHPLRPRPVTP